MESESTNDDDNDDNVSEEESFDTHDKRRIPKTNRLYLHFLIPASKTPADENEQRQQQSVDLIEVMLAEYCDSLVTKTNIKQRIKSCIQNDLRSIISSSKFLSYTQTLDDNDKSPNGHPNRRRHRMKENGGLSLMTVHTQTIICNEDDNQRPCRILTVDWTDIALLHSIMVRTPSNDDQDDHHQDYDDTSRIEFQVHDYENSIRSYVAETKNQQQQQLLPFVASNWWNDHRPVWASTPWTITERLLRHGSIAAVDFVRNTLNNRSNIKNNNLHDNDLRCIVTNTNDTIELSSLLVNHLTNESNMQGRNDDRKSDVIMIYIKPHKNLHQLSIEYDEEEVSGAVRQVSQDIDDEESYRKEVYAEDNYGILMTMTSSSLSMKPGYDMSPSPPPQQQQQQNLHYGVAEQSVSETIENNVVKYNKDDNTAHITPIKLRTHGDETEGNEIIFSDTNCSDVESQITNYNQQESTNVMASPLEMMEDHSMGSWKQAQIDSTGLDLTMLSQLPPNIRSEARLVMALAKQDQEKNNKKNKRQHLKQKVPKKKNPIFERWLSQTSTSNTEKNHNQDRSPLSSPFRTRKRRRQSIEKYFQKIEPK
jgi:hypothetical protein